LPPVLVLDLNPNLNLRRLELRLGLGLGLRMQNDPLRLFIIEILPRSRYCPVARRQKHQL
jgi:hypothetical protein